MFTFQGVRKSRSLDTLLSAKVKTLGLSGPLKNLFIFQKIRMRTQGPFQISHEKQRFFSYFFFFLVEEGE